jgi:hypothetical protein
MQLAVQSSFAFRRFVLHNFANLLGYVKDKVPHLDPSVVRRIKIVQQPDQVFKQSCMMFKELMGVGGGEVVPSHNVSRKKRKILKNTKQLCWGRGGGGVRKSPWD